MPFRLPVRGNRTLQLGLRMRFAVVSLLLLTPFVATADYAIVVSQATHSDPQWKSVVDALVEKYPDAEIHPYTDDVTEALGTLRKQHPRKTCFVATPTEANRAFVAAVHTLTRTFDDDPYTDTQWGILTGYDAANALRIARHQVPLTINNVSSGTEVALEMCNQGVWYDELVKHKKVSRQKDGVRQEERGPADTTAALAETLTSQSTDLFVTSGHATERNWQIGFSYRNGYFQSKDGLMFGKPTTGDRFEIESTNPKVYLPIGNCLMGHIDGPDAMALAWMNRVGVKQMIGYTVVTWYGYGGWGVLDYFVEQPGRYSMNEAFHANHHALIHRLDTYFDDAVDTKLVVGSRQMVRATPNADGRQQSLTSQDAAGLLWDRDTVAFYGDPGWSATMADRSKAFDQTLTIEGDTYTLTIIPNRGEKSFEPINTNGAQRGWRPIVELLPHRIGDVNVLSGADLKPVITDDFVLIPNPKRCDPGRKYEITFTAKRLP